MSKRNSRRAQQQEQEARELEIAARRRAVVQYRLLGVSYRAIGEKLGISHEQTRADEKAFRAEVKAEDEETVMELRARENERLDLARSAIAPKVRIGDLGAIDRWLRISERASKLNGLDAPQKTEISGNMGVQIGAGYDLSKFSPAELDLSEELALRARVQEES